MPTFRVHRESLATALESSADGGVEPIQTVETASAGNAWDLAHGILDSPDAAGLESTEGIKFVEPDFVQGFDYKPRQPENALESFESAEACAPRRADEDWPNDAFGWHLGDQFSQLKQARDRAGDPGDGNRVLIGILDTGYDPGHASLPVHMRYDLARNFTGDGQVNNATDPASAWPLTNPGHGTATIALLAGSQVKSVDGSFNDVLGGAPHADVVPIRIADSVVHFRTSAMAQGIRYAAKIGCRVISISMGGIPTREWADAVNYAYDQGVCIFAAAGNRIGVSPPATLVYPARFRRVVGVCGFTADHSPYFLEGWHRKMHGSFGPESVMGEAMAAFTPNIPWAAMGCGQLVNPNGAGTSSATPQCAAAAALWLQKHQPQASKPWMSVEAVRKALFATADKSPAAGRCYFGNGLLKANDALDVAYDETGLTKQAPDTLSFPWLRLAGALEGMQGQAEGSDAMFETEAIQVFLQSPRMQKTVDQADPLSDDLERPVHKKFLETMRESQGISNALRARLDDVIKRL